MIIIEGMDNTGKTTLIDKLEKQFPRLKRIPKWVGARGPGSMDMMYEHMITKLDQPPQETLHMLFDRFPLISEQVYGPIIRGSIEFDESQLKTAGFRLRLHKPLVIHCIRSPQSIIDSFDDREQMDGVKDKVSELLEAYSTVIKDLRVSSVKYCFDNSAEGSNWYGVQWVVKNYLQRMEELLR